MGDLSFIQIEVFQKEFDKKILLKAKPIRESVAYNKAFRNERNDNEKREWQCIKYLQQQIWLTSLPKIFEIVASITIEASKSDKESRKIQYLVDRGTKTQFFDLFKMKFENEENKESNNEPDIMSESDRTEI